MSSKKRTVKIYRFNKPYKISEQGLLGKERETLDAMFSEDRKEVLKFRKLNNLQKKVIRKIGFQKSWFLLSSNQ